MPQRGCSKMSADISEQRAAEILKIVDEKVGYNRAPIEKFYKYMRSSGYSYISGQELSRRDVILGIWNEAQSDYFDRLYDEEIKSSENISKEKIELFLQKMAEITGYDRNKEIEEEYRREVRRHKEGYTLIKDVWDNIMELYMSDMLEIK